MRILPFRVRYDIYHRIKVRITNSDQYDQLFDNFFLLFFADCAVQILSGVTDTKFVNSLLSISYKVVQPFRDQFEFPFRLQIVKQFSIIISFLSIRYLSRIHDGFNDGFIPHIKGYF